MMQDQHVGLTLPPPRGAAWPRWPCASWWHLPARAEDDPTSAPPQLGDHLVFLTGPKKDQPARADDLELGGPQVQAYPADPKGPRARRLAAQSRGLGARWR